MRLGWAFFVVLGSALVATACGKAASSPADDGDTQSHRAPSRDAASHHTASKGSSGTPEASAPAREAVADEPPPFACGAHTCRAFDSPAAALRFLLEAESPRVIGFGEAHAPAGFEQPTTVARFREQLLPVLAPRSRALLVEILAPPQEGCDDARKQAQKESDAITQGQSETNQNEYLALGLRSRELGVVPDILRASCEQMQHIASPEGGVLAYMETIATLFSESLRKRLERAPDARPLVLAYGGALHNDASPRPGRESWSYAQEVLAATEGAYLELDLMVPELIGDSESWQSFAWYEAYHSLRHQEGTLLMQWGERSATLFFEPGLSSNLGEKERALKE